MKKLALLSLAFAVTALAQKPADPPPQEFRAPIALLGGAEIFGIDRSHSYLGFSIGFLGMSNVRGTFKDYSATIVYDDAHPERSSVTVIIDPATIDTGLEHRDKDLQSERFFDVAKHPTITFRSTSIEAKGADRFVIHGDLTMKGVTKSIIIPMARTVKRTPDSGWGNIRIGGTGSVQIRRKEFGILGNEFWGDKALADDVEITLDILGNRPNYDKWSFNSKDKPSIGELLWKGIEAGGTGAAAAAQFRELKASKPNDYNFGAGQLNVVINRLMQRRRLDDALPLLDLARESYPDEFAFFSRSGELFAAKGDREKAIAMYEKTLAAAPNTTEAIEVLRRLRIR